MTWNEGLDYINARQAERRMREESLSVPKIRHPPRIPIPYDVRMTTNESNSESAIESHENEEADYISARPSRQYPKSNDGSFRDWLKASEQYNVSNLATQNELKELRKRCTPDNWKMQRMIVDDPNSSVIFIAFVSVVVGVFIGTVMKGMKNNDRESFPPTTRSQNVLRCDHEGCTPMFRKASELDTSLDSGSEERLTIDKMMSFLGN